MHCLLRHAPQYQIWVIMAHGVSWVPTGISRFVCPDVSNPTKTLRQQQKQDELIEGRCTSRRKFRHSDSTDPLSVCAMWGFLYHTQCRFKCFLHVTCSSTYNFMFPCMPHQHLKSLSKGVCCNIIKSYTGHLQALWGASALAPVAPVSSSQPQSEEISLPPICRLCVSASMLHAPPYFPTSAHR